MDEAAVIAATRNWVRNFVIGLQLCPFAQRVFEAERIRFVVALGPGEKDILEELTAEIGHLLSTPREKVETTLLIVPQAFEDFLDFNDFVGAVDDRIARLGLEGVLQVAGFHPQYRFEGTAADDVENYTNRSPYPMLHLLREDSITETGWTEEDLLAIPERNIATLRRLGLAEVRKICTPDAPPPEDPPPDD